MQKNKIIYFLLSLFLILNCKESKEKNKNNFETTAVFYKNNSDTLMNIINQLNNIKFEKEDTDSKRLIINNSCADIFSKQYLHFLELKISFIDITNFNDIDSRKFSFNINNVSDAGYELGGASYLHYDKYGDKKNFENNRILKFHIEHDWYYLIIKNF